MQKAFMLLTVLLCLFPITGCNPEFKNTIESPDAAAPTTVSSQDLDQFVRAKVQPTSRAEKYMIYFSWPHIDDGKHIRIRLDKTLVVVDPTQTDFNHEVFHNQVLTYNFEILDASAKVEKTFPIQVKIPRDYVVRPGQNSLTENTKLFVNRFFISNETALYTNGYEFEIQTNELISTNGGIHTFPEGQKAASSSHGRSGGKVFLKGKLAMGHLKLFMRGENGGDGLNGVPYVSRASDGAAPGEGHRECTCKECPLLKKTIFTMIYKPQGCSCVSRGRDGTNGENGLQGLPGGDAGNGGDSGSLKIEIQNGSEFQLETFRQIGLAGVPGLGGDGQPGGLATAPNKNLLCVGARGSDGGTGPKGQNGNSASDGLNDSACIYIASEKQNDCF